MRGPRAKFQKFATDLGAETRSFLCHPYNLFSFLNSIPLSSLVAPVQVPSINSSSRERSDMGDSVPQSTPEKNQVDTMVSVSHIFSSDICTQAISKVDGPEILETQIAFAAVEDSIRPRTRSQTGNIVKRRLPKELNTSSTQKSIAPRKRLRTATKKPPSPPMDADDNQEGHRTESPMTSRDDSGSTTRNPSPFSSTSPLTFLESVVSFGCVPDRRGPRSRATLPVPVPNLTKKSRGRRVPTKQAIDAPINVKDKRMYVCKVEGCGKCFNRGEHLKRHIRSIHTHEKRKKF